MPQELSAGLEFRHHLRAVLPQMSHQVEPECPDLHGHTPFIEREIHRLGLDPNEVGDMQQLRCKSAGGLSLPRLLP